jgi:hypothetical protein
MIREEKEIFKLASQAVVKYLIKDFLKTVEESLLAAV